MFEKESTLVERLVKRSRNSELDWKASYGDSFQVSFKDNSVRIEKQENPGGEEPIYVIELINADGAVVDSFTDFALDQTLGNMSNGPWYRMMGELFGLARRNALGADKVLNSILDDLDETEF